MKRYNHIGFAEATCLMQNVWNFCFKPLTEDNFFVEPWKNQELSDCAEFQPAQTEAESSKIFFFAGPELLILLTDTPESKYLYGAYNQITVCQMQACGSTTVATNHPEASAIEKRIRRRIVKRQNRRGGRLSAEEAAIRHVMLNTGTLLCFKPEAYGQAGYTRG